MNESIIDWKRELDADGILWLVLDKQDSDTNVLSVSVLEQLDSLLDEIDTSLPRAVVFRSGKRGGFIAGADVNEFLDVTTTQEALIMIKRGQSLFSRIEALRCPTIALIEGFCMGGGTELALACDYRIALDEPVTRIGLPEVKLGIHPAYGGLVRSTEIINPLHSQGYSTIGCNRCTTPILPNEPHRAGRWRHLGPWSVYCGINPTDMGGDGAPAVEFDQNLIDRILGRETDFMI